MSDAHRRYRAIERALLQCMPVRPTGQSHLNPKNLRQVVFTQGAAKAFGLETAATRLLAQQIERDMAQHGHILRCVVRPNPARIFIKYHIQDPMNAIFDPPMGANVVIGGCGIQHLARQIVPLFGRGDGIQSPFALNTDHTLEVRPAILIVEKGDHARITDHKRLPLLNPAVAFVDGRGVGHTIRGLERRSGVGKQGDDIRMQLRLIAFERQKIVATALHNLGCNRGLTTHRIDRDRTIAQIEQIQEHGNGRDFIRFAVYGDLTKHDAVLTGPCADKMQGSGAVGVIVGAAVGFAINRNYVAVDLLDGLHPGDEAVLKLGRVNPGRVPFG